MNRDTLLFVGVFVAVFAGASAFVVLQGTEAPELQDQPSLVADSSTPPTTPVAAPQSPAPETEYVTPVVLRDEPATASPSKATPPPTPLPQATGRAPSDEEVAKAMIEKNASWLYLRDKNGKLMVDANGRRKLSALGQRYIHYLEQADKNGIRGAANQHNWAIAKLTEGSKNPPTFKDTAKSMGFNPDSRQSGTMMTREQRVHAVLAYSRVLSAWQKHSNSAPRPFTVKETAEYLGFYPDSTQVGVMMTKEDREFASAVHLEALKAWGDKVTSNAPTGR